MNNDEEKEQVLQETLFALTNCSMQFLQLGADLRALAMMFATEQPKQIIAAQIENLEPNVQACSAFLAEFHRLREMFPSEEEEDLR